MREAIVAKLKEELAQPITTERQVVYILVELRKLLDSRERDARFESLKFYCDWAMHTKMDRSTARNFISSVDALFSASPNITQEENDRLGQLLYLESFRNQLRALLLSEGLSDRICESAEWLNFLDCYSRVIEDCPLVYQNRGDSATAVEQMIFEKRVSTAVSQRISWAEARSFPIRWTVRFRNGGLAHFDLSESGTLPGSTLTVESPLSG